MNGGAAPSLTIEVAGVPITDNHMYGRQGARTWLLPDAVAWRDAVTYAARHASRGLDLGAWPLPLAVAVTVRAPRGDAANFLKLTLDGLKVGLGVDDAHYNPVAVQLVTTRARSRMGASITISPSSQVPTQPGLFAGLGVPAARR